MSRIQFDWNTASKKEKDQEWLKCAIDPVYFIDNYGVAFNARTGIFGAIECYEYQKRVINDFLEHSYNIILKARQTGLSVITAAYVAWRLMFRANEKILILANNGKGAKRFLSYVKTFIDALPGFLQPMNGHKDGRIKWNDTRIEFSNMSWAESVAASPQAGRGENPSLVILDEFAFVERDKDIWTAISFALSMSKGDCIMISTPFGSGNKYHESWVEAEKGTGRFHPIRVHWTENPVAAKGLKTSFEKGKTVFWSPWYEEQRQKMNFDSVLIAQELDLSFLGSKMLAVDEDILIHYRGLIDSRNIVPSHYFRYQTGTFTKVENEFWVWKTPVPGAKYILAGDVARGDGRDYSTVQIIDVASNEQVAEFQGKMDPDVFANLIDAAGRAYNTAFVVVECNSFGLATTYKLTRGLGYDKRNIFWSKSIQKIHVRPSEYEDFKVEQDQKIPGFQTTTQSKVMVVDSVRRAMRENAVKINSPRLMNEFNTWVMESISENRVTAKAEAGYNDDLIMALGIGLYIRETEYSNIVVSREVARAMLDAFATSSTPMYGKQQSPEQKAAAEKELKEAMAKNQGLFFFRDGQSTDGDDPNDVSWLMG